MGTNTYKKLKAEELPRIKVLDSPVRKRKLRKEVKEACLAISFVWLLGMAFMAQFVVENSAIADIFSIMLLAVAGLQVIGR